MQTPYMRKIPQKIRPKECGMCKAVYGKGGDVSTTAMCCRHCQQKVLDQPRPAMQECMHAARRIKQTNTWRTQLASVHEIISITAPVEHNAYKIA